MELYHYYDKTVGAFKNLSDVSPEEAKAILKIISASKPGSQSAKRHPSYAEDRLQYEEIIRTEFIKKGGIIKRKVPHYMVVEHIPWLSTWFENGSYVKIPIEAFDLKTVSFTYGDSHPVFSPRVNKMDDKEYRRKLYTYEEILEIIERYGLPQHYNDCGSYGPEHYVEAHIWNDEPISQYIF